MTVTPAQKSCFADRRVVFVVVCILLVYGLSVYKKEQGYQFWLANPGDYIVNGVLPMATMDAYHWLKMARDLDAGQLGKGLHNPTKGYPDLVEYHDANLLARLVSLGTVVTGGDYYRSGLLLVSVLGGLFVFPLFFYFNRLGFGSAAVMGGLVGVFSNAYYNRSAMGNLDTDLLNLFFPLVVSFFFLLISPERSLRGNLLLAWAAGAGMYLFNWWYEQPGIILAYLPFVLLYLLLTRIPWQQILLLLLVFLVASGPEYVLQSLHSVQVFVRAYFFPLPVGGEIWPDVMPLIEEAQQPGYLAALKSVHGLLPLVLGGCAGLLYLYLRHFRQMVLLFPVLLLGLWSLFGPIRFAMYLAPLVGVGIGVVIELLVRAGVGRLSRSGPRPLLGTFVSVAMMAALFFSTTAYTGFHRQPKPTLPTATTRAFLEIKQLVPDHAAMISWWDMGYPLMEIGDFATYHDGSLHGGLRSTLVGKGLSATDQRELVAMLAYLEDHGFDALQTRLDSGSLTAAEMERQVFSYPGAFRAEQVYLLYTEDMIRKFGSITEFGMWNFAEQKSDWVFYERWNCFSRVGNVYKCQEGFADLDRGVISDGVVDVPLNAVLYVNDGNLVNRRDYRSDAQYYLQILMKDNRIFQVQVVDARLFATNFNQQFVLGNYDRRFFAEVYNDFPVARVFRVLPQ